MQAVIDLNPRQANRVLEQAVRVHAKLELEPRTVADEPFEGIVVDREGDLLRVDLSENMRKLPLYSLIGAYCDIRAVLSGQLYLFSSSIVDAIDQGRHVRLLIGLPEAIQVANRRRFERRTLAEFSQVRIWPTGSKTPYIGELCNIAGEGLSCRMIRGELDELLLVGDDVRVSFDLAGSGESFSLPSIVCNKTATRDGQQLIVGLQFRLVPTDPISKLSVDRLRTLLCELTINSTETDGES